MLAEEGIVDALFTAVHATHVTHREIALLGVGPQVCACPTTERDLGDGFLPAIELVQAGTPIAVGSDSQTMIAPLEELRLLEYHERLRKMRRVVLGVAQTEATSAVAPLLLDFGTRAGARALRLPAGEIETGALADLVAVDLEHPALEGWTNETLGALLTLCAPPNVVTDVWVAGVQRIESRYHVLEAESAEAFRRVAAALHDAPPVAVPHGDTGA
jgi:formimidoylglutamate deiminase